MNKSKLIAEVASQLGISRREAKAIVEAILEAIRAALSRRDTVALPGFGTFSVKSRAARMGRNPQTGERIEVPSANVPVFRAGRRLKEYVDRPATAAAAPSDDFYLEGDFAAEEVARSAPPAAASEAARMETIRSSDEPGPRRLQADVHAMTPDGNFEDTQGLCFIAGRQHRILVSVGRGASVASSVGFDEPDIPETQAFVELDVHLVCNDEVQSGSIHLPRDRDQDSDVAPFDVVVPADASTFSALVVVRYKGRILQADTLRGPVFESLPAPLTCQPAIELVNQALPHDLEDLDGFEAFGACALSDGQSVVGFSETGISAGDLAGVYGTFDRITRKLFRSSDAISRSDEGLLAEAARTLLTYMAVNGRVLYAGLVGGLLAGFREQSRIQIVTTNPSRCLPLEFVFDGPSPSRSATLCPSWQDALRTGICPTCGDDWSGTPLDEEGHATTICPLGFWGLRKVIERHAGLGDRERGYEFYVRGVAEHGSRTQLNPLRRVLFAASEKVPPDEIDQTIATIGNVLTPNDVSEATGWADWTGKVRSQRPTLLMSLPHNAIDPDWDINTLEICGANDLRAGDVCEDHVGRREDTAMVMLLGCDTAQSEAHPFLSFVGEFRQSGAAVVIGTLETIIAEHSAEIARALVAAFAALPSSSTIGDLLLGVRRQLFSEGIVIGLAVVAFGDADYAVSGGT